MPGLFITATGTDVGKTFVACALIRALRAEGREVGAFKPALSGFEGIEGSDAGRLLEALGETDLDRMSPLRFIAPLAPPSAARLEGESLTLDDLAARCEARLAEEEWKLILIEGAGGLMSPLAEDGTNLDLLVRLQLPSVLVTGSYLGSISHTFTAMEVMFSRGLPLRAVVISQSQGDHPPLSEMTNAMQQYYPDIPVIVVGRDDEDAVSLLTPHV